MGDYIPQEELEKFLASCNDAAAQKAAREAAERARIQADNVGHKLLSKMGWKEGVLFFFPSFFFHMMIFVLVQNEYIVLCSRLLFSLMIIKKFQVRVWVAPERVFRIQSWQAVLGQITWELVLINQER